MDEQTRFRFSRKMNFDFMRLPSGRINLGYALEMVEHEELVRRLGGEEWAYLFKHALTQDAAYSTLMRQERKRLHQMVAETLENLYADRLDELASLLLTHYAGAGDTQKTFQYGIRAGTEAARRSANAEACSNYDAALEALSQLAETPERQRDLVDTLLKRLTISLRAEGPHRSLERLRQAESVAQTLQARSGLPQDRLRLAHVWYWIAQAHLHSGATGEAVRYMKQALTIAEEVDGGQELRALASSIIGRGLALQGRFNEAETHLSVGANLLDKFAMNHEWLMSVGGLGVSIAARGDYALGVEQARRGLTMALELKILTSVALGHMWLGLVHQMGGDATRWEAESAAVIEIAGQAGDNLLLYAGHGSIAGAQSRLGNHQAAFESMEKSQRIARQLGGRLVFYEWYAASAAEIALNAGLFDAAIARSEETVQLARESGSIFAEGLAQRVWGQALGASGFVGYPEIEEHFAASVRAFEAGDARLEIARTRVARGKFLYTCGDAAAARQDLEQAAAQFHASGLEREYAEARELMQ